MIDPKVRVEGLREVQRALRAAEGASPAELREASKDAAEVVATEAEHRAPRRSGRLARSIRAQAQQRGAHVKAGSAKRVPYVGPIHWGWPARNIHAQPFLVEAREEKFDEVRAIYAERIEDLLRRHFDVDME